MFYIKLSWLGLKFYIKIRLKTFYNFIKTWCYFKIIAHLVCLGQLRWFEILINYNLILIWVNQINASFCGFLIRERERERGWYLSIKFILFHLYWTFHHLHLMTLSEKRTLCLHISAFLEFFHYFITSVLIKWLFSFLRFCLNFF